MKSVEGYLIWLGFDCEVVIHSIFTSVVQQMKPYEMQLWVKIKEHSKNERENVVLIDESDSSSH